MTDRYIERVASDDLTRLVTVLVTCLDRGMFEFSLSFIYRIAIMRQMQLPESLNLVNMIKVNTYCICGDGIMPGVTRGSVRSTTSWEQPKRRKSDAPSLFPDPG